MSVGQVVFHTRVLSRIHFCFDSLLKIRVGLEATSERHLLHQRRPSPVAIVLIVVGFVLILAAIFAPAQSVTIIFKPFSIVTEVSPDRIVITGTDIEAKFLELALGIALFLLGLSRFR